MPGRISIFKSQVGRMRGAATAVSLEHSLTQSLSSARTRDSPADDSSPRQIHWQVGRAGPAPGAYTVITCFF